MKFLILITLTILASCEPSKPLEVNKFYGRGMYNAYCISCHNKDPNYNGSVGPAVAGSSYELLKAKVINGTYPPNYTPKRNTSIMPKFDINEMGMESLSLFLGDEE